MGAGASAGASQVMEKANTEGVVDLSNSTEGELNRHAYAPEHVDEHLVIDLEIRGFDGESSRQLARRSARRPSTRV